MKWLLEPEVFRQDSKPLMKALDDLGVEYTVCKFGVPYEEVLSGFHGPAIFHGSLQFGKLIRSMSSEIKVYCTLSNYECVHYYPRFGEYLLNSDYIMLPLGDILRRKSWIFRTLAQGSLFFRPSSGYKTFTGLVLSEGELEKELPFWERQMDPQSIVIAAPVRPISKEWRAVVVGEKVITAGQYRESGLDVRIREVPEKVLNYAQDVVNSVHYRPDPAWTIDVCESGDELKVLEVGSFSCAGLYACDYTAVIKAVNELAEDLGLKIVEKDFTSSETQSNMFP